MSIQYFLLCTCETMGQIFFQKVGWKERVCVAGYCGRVATVDSGHQLLSLLVCVSKEAVLTDTFIQVCNYFLLPFSSIFPPPPLPAPPSPPSPSHFYARGPDKECRCNNYFSVSSSSGSATHQPRLLKMGSQVEALLPNRYAFLIN